jgi:hypothetical protein
MDKDLFERNLLALVQRDPDLCSRLSGAETTLGRYKFLESRTGETVPALVDTGGTAHPLHSLVDPRREGDRLLSTVKEGYLIFLGLGGGYHAAAALDREDVQRVLVIDYDINGMAELLSSRDYIHIFSDPRFHLLVDPGEAYLEQLILDTYQPALFGGIRTLPLRIRTGPDQNRFNRAGEAIKSAIDRLSGDYSVQAYFGTRWFSNIIRNVLAAEQQEGPLPPVFKAAICAAGPSLDSQLPLIREDPSRYLIATDTSLPGLLQAGIKPDAVVSIDCQHISYYHFMEGIPAEIPLFLDLASPPLVASRSAHPRFFAGGHPLTHYISRYWRPLPLVDTAGANVTYAALSLAENLGARDITLYGADFSYPQGRTYARGTYIYPYFENRQTRLTPLESLHSRFLYRGAPLKRVKGERNWYYETPSLRRYREGLEAKIRLLPGRIWAAPGGGATIRLEPDRKIPLDRTTIRLFSPGRAALGAREFLHRYREKIAALPPLGNNIPAYLEALTGEESRVLSTLLPGAAALKRRGTGGDILEAVRSYCLGELDKVLG